MLGIRWTSLDGYSREDAAVKFAGAGIMTRPLSSCFEIVAEPGIQSSGSHNYLFVYLTLPVLARFAYRVTPRARVRALAGMAPGYLYGAYRREQKESSGYEWNHISGIATWNASLIAGIGFDYQASVERRLFAELRVQRGVTTVDGGMSPLSVFNQELGFWFGFTQ